MINLGDRMSDREVDEMISDAGGGSKIDYAKFVKSMNKKANSPSSD
jgi:Ca2+-binding EF-hand superfamily protein